MYTVQDKVNLIAKAADCVPSVSHVNEVLRRYIDVKANVLTIGDFEFDEALKQIEDLNLSLIRDVWVKYNAR